MSPSSRASTWTGSDSRTTSCTCASSTSSAGSRRPAGRSSSGTSASARPPSRCSRRSRRAGAIRTSWSRAAGRRASRRPTACRLGCGSCSSTSDRVGRVLFARCVREGPRTESRASRRRTGAGTLTRGPNTTLGVDPMRQSSLFGRTLREAPADAQTPGHRLMLRAAIARPLASGLYTWLPLGFRVAKKVEQIIREEMDRIGCQEMEMPVLTPAELWKSTGRWDALEPITFRTRDHNGREFMVSYTHEEAVHSHAMSEIQSYKQMPLMVYHFQSKGRDEARPRAGLLRVREFVMKDAYSFDIDQAGLEKSYKAQHGAYERIFKRMGLDAISVESDTGAMGGDIAHEFQVLTEVGEDRVVICSNCDYRANMERATRMGEASAPEEGAAQRSEIATPSTTSIEALVSMLHVSADRLLKTLLLRDGSGKVVAVVLPGDRDVNEAKIRKLLGTSEVKFANDGDFSAAGSVPGYIGPV